jgi:amino acid transporter
MAAVDQGPESALPGLQRHFGLLQATALNVSMIVGAGVFLVIPLMLLKVPGPYAILGWVVAGLLMIVDGMVWSELAAALPGSGGSYVYLLECYGRHKWGRVMSFLFVWQFLISGPMELATGLIAIAVFSNALSPAFAEFNAAAERKLIFLSDPELSLTYNPARVIAFGIGVFILLLLYRRITVLARMTVVIWVGVLGIIAWILFEGVRHFDPALAFHFPDKAAPSSPPFAVGLGGAMALAMYSYLGYYNVCYIGDEVRDPGRTIPRSILLSTLLVTVLFIGVHLALLGVVPTETIPKETAEIDRYNLPAEFMRRIHGDGAATLITLMLIWSCFGSAFSGLLGYSRIPYGAARQGHFFSVLGRVHPVHQIPHLSLLFVGVLTLFWSFFDLGLVIGILITTRILEQFIAQCVGVVLLRRLRPELPRPYRMWLYPLPAGLALVGWLYIYLTSGGLAIGVGLGTLLAGMLIFLVWTRRTREWPFNET